MVTIPAWHSRAACANADPDIFFPSGYAADKVRVALGYCNDCPVRQTCLQEALTDYQEYGIFGGTLPHQRRKMLSLKPGKKRAVPRTLVPHGTPGAVSRHRRAKEKLCDDCRVFNTTLKREEKRRLRKRQLAERMAS